MAENRERIRLKVGEFEVEIEGSSEFVDKQLAFVKQEWLRVEDVTAALKRSVGVGEPAEIREQPTLRQFYGERRPRSQVEGVTVILYWLKHYEGKDRVKAKELEECYDRLIPSGVRKPRDVRYTLANAKRRGGYAEPLKPGSEYWTITSAGENLVNLDLPRIS